MSMVIILRNNVSIPVDVAGSVIGALMGAVNCVVIVGVAVVCVVTVRESFLQRRRLAKSEN